MKAETIFALSTAVGVAAVAVIRVSGPAAGEVLLALSGRVGLPAPRRAVVCTLRDPKSGDELDRALCLWFAAPNSFTGEDVVELHVHGGYGVVKGVMGALAETRGLRLAVAGEFTRRAFENGKMELVEVEALSDLVAARTGEQVRQALESADQLGRRCLDWRTELVGVLARLEAAIDFVDDDVGPVELADNRQAVGRILRAIEETLRDAGRAEVIRRGYTVAILGQPNVGKSSLLNRLAGTEAAIVSDVAGTTRDVVQVELDLDGLAVRICDTAGLREQADGVELEGIRRAEAMAVTADLVIVVHDATAPGGALDICLGQKRLDVANKGDLVGGTEAGDEEMMLISAKTGLGIDTLVSEVRDALRTDDVPVEAAIVGRRRQREALEGVIDVATGIEWGAPLDVTAEGVRATIRELEGVTGAVAADRVLDDVFAEFCIGK